MQEQDVTEILPGHFSLESSFRIGTSSAERSQVPFLKLKTHPFLEILLQLPHGKAVLV